MTNNYAVFLSSPIDNWDDFAHIKDLDRTILSYIRENPACDFTRSQVWRSVLNKLHWAWCECKVIDKDLRSSDVYIFLEKTEFGFTTSILFKSDNNGTVNLIMDDCFDVNARAALIPHEFEGEWERVIF